MQRVQVRTLCYALQMWVVLVLSHAATIQATKAQKHICYFDEIHKGAQADLPTVENLAGKMTTSSEKRYVRIGFSHKNLLNESYYCKNEGSKIADAHGVQVVCQKKDVLTSEKTQNVLQIVRSAVAMHISRLKVEQVPNGFKVPTLQGPLCKLFAVPEQHKNTGVSDADMVLYVASFPSSKRDMFAAGAPCAQIDGGRPVVGVLTYTTEHIVLSVYSVRVAAHEIAHALGFTYNMMRKKFGDKLQNASARYKAKVQVVNTPTVTQFAKKQYDCHRSWAAEIEDEKGALSVPSHSHWERRNVLEELMVGIVTAGYYTYLTLAFFQDLGFYEANLAKAEEMDWGKGGGCKFIDNFCTGTGVQPFTRFFFHDKRDNLYCAPGLRAMGKGSPVYQDNSLPYEYQYFYSAPGYFPREYYAGETRLLTDRCPVYEEDKGMSCTDAGGSAPGLKGANSWCLRRQVNYWFYGFIDGGVCAKVTFGSNGDVYVQAGEKDTPTKCIKNGYFYTATFDYQGKSQTFDCPTPNAVKQDQNMHNSFLKADKPRASSTGQTSARSKVTRKS